MATTAELDVYYELIMQLVDEAGQVSLIENFIGFLDLKFVITILFNVLTQTLIVVGCMKLWCILVITTKPSRAFICTEKKPSIFRNHFDIQCKFIRFMTKYLNKCRANNARM